MKSRHLSCTVFHSYFLYPIHCPLYVLDNGTIEIKQPLDKWFTLVTIAGRVDTNLRGLQWSKTLDTSHQGRLFGVSLNGYIFEIDLTKQIYTNILDCYGGAAWCMSMNPYRSKTLSVGKCCLCGDMT
jgi:hypothetical protein